MFEKILLGFISLVTAIISYIFSKKFIDIEQKIEKISKEIFEKITLERAEQELIGVMQYYSGKISNIVVRNFYIEKTNRFISVINTILEQENFYSLKQYEYSKDILTAGYKYSETYLKNIDGIDNLKKEAFLAIHSNDYMDFIIKLKEIYLDTFNKKEQRILKLAKEFLDKYSNNIMLLQ